MWEFGNAWTDSRSTEMLSNHAMMHDIHVLLVDHDSEALINTAKLLQICQYRVTYVQLASAAITMLSTGKTKFDLILANINSPDLYGFKLLQFGVNIDIPVVLMSIDDNSFMAMKALEHGALLYIKKPVTIEFLQCLWQHILREKTQAIREKDRLVATNYNLPRGIEFRNVNIHEEENPIIVDEMTMNKCTSKKKNRMRKGVEDEEYDSDTISNNNVKRKMCTEWTRELHSKFMDAIEQLGDGRCFPKEILELMNVPGLTRMQVASHLQKCRNDNWGSSHGQKALAAETRGPQPKPRKFGSKPQLAIKANSQERPGTGQGSETDQVMNNGGHENHVGTPPSMTNTSIQHHYLPALPDSTNGRPASAHSRNPSSDDFFNFSETGCMINNISGGSGTENTNQGTPGAYQYSPSYTHEQNSAGDSRSQRSSDTSNFARHDSETRSNEILQSSSRKFE